MKRRYKIIVLLLLAALSVTSVYGVLTLSFKRTYTGTVTQIDNPLEFNLHNSTDTTIIPFSNPGIQFDVMDGMTSGTTEWYELVFVDGPPAVSVAVSFTASNASGLQTLELGAIKGYTTTANPPIGDGTSWTMGSEKTPWDPWTTSMYLRWEVDTALLNIEDGLQIIVTVSEPTL